MDKNEQHTLTVEEIALQLTLKSIEDGLVFNKESGLNTNAEEYVKNNSKAVATFYNNVLHDLILKQ